MSVLGTSVAAGVAQAGLQSQQVARRRDQRTRQTREQSQRVHEIFEAHIRGLQEDGDNNSAARLAVDTQTAGDHEDPVEDALHRPVADRLDAAMDGEDQCPMSPPPTVTAASPAAVSDDRPLYRHLDVTA